MINQTLSGNTVQGLNSDISGTNREITSDLNMDIPYSAGDGIEITNKVISNTGVLSVDGETGHVELHKVSERLSLYPDANPTKATRGKMSLYVDNDGVSGKITLQQIKNMNTKIVVSDNHENINKLDVGDFIFSKE